MSSADPEGSRPIGGRGAQSIALALGIVSLLLVASTALAEDRGLTLAADGAVLTGAPVPLKLEITGPPGDPPRPVELSIDGRTVETLDLATGEHKVQLDARLDAGRHRITARTGGTRVETEIVAKPGWLSIVPPLVAIGLALVFKDVLISLFVGIFSGALILFGGNPVTAFARSIDTFIAPSLTDFDRARILIFTTLLGGMVGLISKNGGTRGLVERLSRHATTARRGQVATWLMGILIFFDDYANTLIVGPTMRPITDKLRVSREKLAYIVDSTAAPIASIIPISTWIGFEIGLIGAAFALLDLPFNPYTTFIASIPYRFYPIFALVLGFSIAFFCRDFGPMLKAERRASSTGEVIAHDDIALANVDDDELAPPEGKPRRAINALLPILTVILVTLLGLWSTGTTAVSRADYPSTFKWVQDVFSSADSYNALLWASLSGVAVAMLLALVQKILDTRTATGAMVQGFRAMLMALVVLILAWSIGEICADLHTADWVVERARDVSPRWLPALTFFLAAATAFATGTSWGTMGILMPLVIPIANGLSRAAGLAPDGDAFYAVMVGTISSVLAGAVWGDHCSPISDTTILSSTASGCDHIAHVRTQMPYALSAGFLGVLIGDIPTAYGLSPWISIVAGGIVIVAVVRFRGRRSDWSGARA